MSGPVGIVRRSRLAKSDCIAQPILDGTKGFLGEEPLGVARVTGAAITIVHGCIESSRKRGPCISEIPPLSCMRSIIAKEITDTGNDIAAGMSNWGGV